ncbi:TATA box-binding protein-associated factor RNA polymerase I subunit A isoform X2 [Cricetulus griseus]|uniref:TATA box-binding protein-associated factor RNA polymerase I subunit A isoform X2 n=1 Tax=Cricetulus griseus TaxID=10029 RepID=A0A9J7K7X8_CRIGR|nr:TATA box-binding protein-associated factor RNA polymerase I subunit A isoform X2 [Cricetulus griseus]XP_035312085.1 TATA box-binding protein-associated factor RNA polymerase I subunit A isoform X2 [Cricetulus griseus]
MSDFDEELTKLALAEDGKRETSVFSNPGMHFPWLQERIETVVTGGKKKRDFAQTTSACLSFIQEALLKHQWQQAAEYMHSYLQTLEDSDTYKRQNAPEVIWKLGSEILFYHPKSNVETFNNFADRMKNIGVLNYLKISLQHALYLIHHGKLEDANRNLSDAETWRYGEKSSSQEVLINLVQAYKGLLQYHTWSKKKTELSEIDKDDYAYTSETGNSGNQSCRTSTSICALLKTPGVWDPFVKSYVEILHEIVPSHPLMLEFHTLLRKSDTEEHQKLGLSVLFEFLDFAGCTKNITAWKYLAKCLKQTLMEGHLVWVEEEWMSRRSWWPTFHFSFFWAKSDWKADADLACEKAFVVGILLGKGCRYFRYIVKQDHETLKKKIKRMKKCVKKYSIVNPGVCT